jgi:PAS domain S-box-containing protein
MRSRVLKWTVGAGLVLALGVYVAISRGHGVIRDRVYRIGWHEDPPFQQMGDDGSASGSSVELIREAARRAGIRLEWVWRSDNSEDALRNNRVDLWPLITITPERRRFLHISDPYMQHENVFLVRAESPYHQVSDLARATISHLDRQMTRRLVRAALPDARLVAKPSLDETLQSVCLQHADAVFAEEYSAVSVLLSGRQCSSNALRVLSAPGLDTKLGVGSTFAASAVADEIRRQIGDMPEPTLTSIVTRWGYFAPENLASINATLSARRRERRLTQAIFLFASLFALTLVSADRIRRQRNRIKRLQAEATIRESEARFRNMADTAPAMIWVSGLDKGCSFFNKGWLMFTGRTLDQELGNGWSEGVHPEDLNRCMAVYSSSFDVRRDFSMEYRLRRADGQYRWVFDNGVPRFELNGDFVGYVGACTDITDLKHAQEKNLAGQKLESVGRLAGGIAHDFNNLLGAVLAHAELALEEIADGSAPDAALERIRVVAIRGAEIVRQLMIYAGQENAVIELVDLSRVVEDTLELLKVSISKDAVLETDLAQDLPAVRANAAQLQQVVMNLVTNASEAIDQIGVVRIVTAAVALGPSSLAEGSPSLPAGNYVRLEISDTGCGMTPEAQARVFDPFFSTKFAGRGLGLAVVQGIVRSLNGAIHFVSAPGHGSAFQILFPCVSETAQTAATSVVPASGEEIRGRGSAILIVEDEDTLRVAVSTMLEKKGFSLIQASDGSEALDLIRASNQPIDLMLLDFTLPGESSQQVFEEAKRLRPEMAVIWTSAYGEGRVAASLGGARSDPFIRKPYRLGQLLDLIQKSLSAQQPVRSVLGERTSRRGASR